MTTVLQIVEARDQAVGADDELLAVVLDVAAARVGVRPLERVRSPRRPRARRPAGASDRCTTWYCLSSPPKLLTSTMPGHRAQLRADVPVERLLELHQRVPLALARRTGRSRRGRSRSVPSPGLPYCGGHRVLGLAHALEHHLAREVDVGAVLEHDGDDREAVLRDRADLVDLGDARPSRARRGRVTYCSTSTGDSAGAARDDLHLDVGDVGDGVDGQVQRRADARRPRAGRSPISTTARFRSDQATMRPRSSTSLLLAERALEDGALEREHALDDDLLARAQAAQDLDPARRRCARA